MNDMFEIDRVEHPDRLDSDPALAAAGYAPDAIGERGAAGVV